MMLSQLSTDALEDYEPDDQSDDTTRVADLVTSQ